MLDNVHRTILEFRHIVTPEKRRGCNSLAVPPLYMGTKPAEATVRLGGWEGAGSRLNHEPEDLLGALTDVPSWAGELARMSCGCNPQGLSWPWGFFVLRYFPYKLMSEGVLAAAALHSMWSVPATRPESCEPIPRSNAKAEGLERSSSSARRIMGLVPTFCILWMEVTS